MTEDWSIDWNTPVDSDSFDAVIYLPNATCPADAERLLRGCWEQYLEAEYQTASDSRMYNLGLCQQMMGRYPRAFSTLWGYGIHNIVFEALESQIDVPEALPPAHPVQFALVGEETADLAALPARCDEPLVLLPLLTRTSAAQLVATEDGALELRLLLQ